MIIVAESMREVLSQSAETFSLKVFDGGEFRRMIDRALTSTKRWQKRQRLLRAPLILWTVIAMSIFRSLSISNVFMKILDAMRGDLDVKLKAVTNEAGYKARERLGWEPLQMFALALPELPRIASRLPWRGNRNRINISSSMLYSQHRKHNDQ